MLFRISLIENKRNADDFWNPFEDYYKQPLYLHYQSP
jgi:hypothetical protein